MGKLVAFNMVTLDGFFEGPNQDIAWHNVDDEFNAYAIDNVGRADTLLFGRVTYEGMASFWPTPFALETDPVVAEFMNRLPKVVFSRTLDKADWNNTRLIKDNIADEVRELKQQAKGDVCLLGSAKVMVQLIEANLVDECRIMVNPVLLGRGTPLFQGISHPVQMRLVNTRTFGNGNVLLCYAPLRDEQESHVYFD